jgi:hypothetical protein
MQTRDSNMCMCQADFRRLYQRSADSVPKATRECYRLLQYMVEHIVINTIQCAMEAVVARNQQTLKASDLLALKGRSRFVVQPEWLPSGGDRGGARVYL